MRRVPRWVPTIFAGLFATIFLLPLISSHVRQWAEARGHMLLLDAATRVMSGLGDASQTTEFVFITGFFIGAALLLWIDYALRRRTYGGGAQDMGLIIAGIGLTTFVIGLGIYFFPPPTPVQSATKTPSPAPPPSLEKEALAWSKTPILGWSKQPDGAIYARTFGVVGTNIGADEIQLDDIYIVSGITGARIDLKVQVANEGLFAAKDTNPITADAYIQLSSDELGPSGGIPERDFLTDWATIDFVAEYGGRQHRTTFDRATHDQLTFHHDVLLPWKIVLDQVHFDRFVHIGNCLASRTQIVHLLQVHPELGACLEVEAEPDRRIGGYGPRSVEYLRHSVGWHLNVTRQLGR